MLVIYSLVFLLLKNELLITILSSWCISFKFKWNFFSLDDIFGVFIILFKFVFVLVLLSFVVSLLCVLFASWNILCDVINLEIALLSFSFWISFNKEENDRGVSVIFGEKIVQDFNKKNDLDLIIRAHQVVDDGYEFFAQRQLITIFSAPNYCGEFDNSAGIMIIDESLTCSLKVLRPVENLKK